MELFTVNKGEYRLYEDHLMVVTRTRFSAGLRFVGEIDISNAHSVTESLADAHGGDGDVHADVSAVSFCDISGIRAFVEAANTLGEGHRLQLHGLPDLLKTVIMITGWVSSPNLGICDCPGDER